MSVLIRFGLVVIVILLSLDRFILVVEVVLFNIGMMVFKWVWDVIFGMILLKCMCCFIEEVILLVSKLLF